MTTIFCIYDDLLHNLLWYLSIKDIVRLQSTCQYFQIALNGQHNGAAKYWQYQCKSVCEAIAKMEVNSYNYDWHQLRRELSYCHTSKRDLVGNLIFPHMHCLITKIPKLLLEILLMRADMTHMRYSS